MDGDGGSKMVVVNDCLDGKEVLGRVLRKFGKEGEQEGGWGVWAGESGAGGTGGREFCFCFIHHESFSFFPPRSVLFGSVHKES